MVSHLHFRRVIFIYFAVCLFCNSNGDKEKGEREIEREMMAGRREREIEIERKRGKGRKIGRRRGGKRHKGNV